MVQALPSRSDSCLSGVYRCRDLGGELARNRAKRAAYSQPLAIGTDQWANTPIHKLRCFRAG